MEEGRKPGPDSDPGFVAAEKHHQVQSASTGGGTTEMNGDREGGGRWPGNEASLEGALMMKKCFE